MTLIFPFTVRETEVQRACPLCDVASTLADLAPRDSRAPALSAAICCPGVDFSPALCMFCWISLVLKMERAALALEKEV